MVFLVHIALAGLLFFAIGWIGRHSHSLGYISLSLFVRRDEAPAFNLVLRLLGPLVFVTVAASVFYWLTFDRFVQDIWRVALYYFVGRIVFNLLMGRALLINWAREVSVGAVCIWITWLIYEEIIKHKKTLLPDFSTATNELWVFVAVFIYLVLNKVDTGTKGAERRKKKFLLRKREEMERRFGHLLEVLLPDSLSRSIGLTILLYESFNRPIAAQKLERFLFPKGVKSLGPMQITTTKKISDIESVTLGFERVAASYLLRKHEMDLKGEVAESPYYRRWYVVKNVAADYNRDDAYVRDITELHGMVITLIYPELEVSEKKI